MTITYTNATGDTLTLHSRKPYFLQKVDGAGDMRQIINTFRAPDQDGAFIISNSVETRNITIEGAILAETPAVADELKARLRQVFAPKKRGLFFMRARRIPCMVEEVAFSPAVSARNPSFFISLLCPSPFFEALDAVRIELAAWISTFSFPLEIPEDSGIEMGRREPRQIISIYNAGDVPCRCEIHFSALGELTNPELMNVDTGEVFRLHKTFSAGEAVRVYTHFAEKRVIQNRSGITSNAFHTMDSASTFLQLAPGSNTLRYHSDSNLDSLEVNIYFRPLYLGA
jgi:hypothetical protein